MFEQSLVGIEDGRVRRRRRWVAAGSLAAQMVVVALCVVVPMMSPAVMPVVSGARLKVVTLPLKPKLEPPKPVRTTDVRTAAVPAPRSAASAVAEAPAAARNLHAAGFSSEAPTLLPYGGGTMKDGLPTGVIGAGVGSGTGPVVVVRAASHGNEGRRMTLSSGVTAGMLLAPIRPEYPQIAKATHTEGLVVMTATIDRNGRIVGLQVISGPALLRKAAEDAVREARYRPYLLNGAAVEVETTISVNFRMSGE